MDIHVTWGSQNLGLQDFAGIANVCIAILALFVAGLSIWFSRKALIVQERHNRLSVRPIPFVSLADYENLLRVKIVNNGSGPMIVTDVRVQSAGGVPLIDVISWMPNPPAGLFWSNYASWVEARSILPSEELILLELKGDLGDQSYRMFRDGCRSVLCKLNLSFAYSDVYDAKFPRHARDLTWFGRDKGTRKSLPQAR